MITLAIEEVERLHTLLILATGGKPGIRDRGALKSAVSQPLMTFGGADLYQSWAEKAAALGFSIIKNHPFVDGNKRVGHAAMEAFLMLNEFEIVASTDEQEVVVLGVASGEIDREQFTIWLQSHIFRIGDRGRF